MQLRRVSLGLIAGCLVCVAALGACGDDGSGDGDAGAPPIEADGEALYAETCAACHGADLKGTDSGPPFLDPVYAPNHHPDEAFFAAVENGVQPHHWDFGPMPPQTSIDPEEAAAIVAYVREQQAEAGITEDPSH